MENKRTNNGLILVLIILVLINIGLGIWNMFKQNEISDLIASSQASKQPVATVDESVKSPHVFNFSAEAVKSATSEIGYIVKEGDWLSTIAQKYQGVSWQEIAELNAIQNPDLIYPGQKFKIPANAILLPVLAKKTHVPHNGSVSYCKIGADPVNPHRELSVLEHEHHLEHDVLVTMGTGSGKTVKCKLHAGEIVVIEDFPAENEEIERVATWVRKCGNPIFSNLIIATIKPTQPAEPTIIPQERGESIKGPIMGSMYENPNRQKTADKENQ